MTRGRQPRVLANSRLRRTEMADDLDQMTTFATTNSNSIVDFSFPDYFVSLTYSTVFALILFSLLYILYIS